MQTIHSINTIFYCDNFRETVSFYQDLLKLPINFSQADWLIEFRINDGACISVADARKCTVASAKGVGITLTFSVDDLQMCHQELGEKGVSVGKICTSEWRAPWFYIFDPEGHRIEIWQASEE